MQKVDWTRTPDRDLVVTGYGPESCQLENLKIRQRWHLDEEGVHLTVEWIALDTVEVLDDAGILLYGRPFNLVTFVNTHQNFTASFNGEDSLEVPLQNAVALLANEWAMTVSVMNPFTGDFVRSEQGVRLRVLRTREPHSYFPGVRVHSVLAPGDTVRRDLFFALEPPLSYPFSRQRVVVLPSPHPRGGDGTLSFIGDELPLGPLWVPFTTPNDPSAPLKSSIVRLFQDFPKVRLSFLITFDMLFQIYNNDPSHTDGWFSNAGDISFVPFDRCTGNRSVRIHEDADTSAFIYQNVDLNRNDRVDVRANLYIPELLDTEGGFRFKLQTQQGIVVDSSRYWNSTQGWQAVEWQLPNVLPHTASYRIMLEVTHGGGSAFVDDVELIASGRAVPLHNPGFETGTTYVTYDSPEYDWQHAHGAQRIATRATGEYQEFLRRIDRGEKRYGWEDRMGLGIHSYHHVGYGGWIFGAPIPTELTWDDPPMQKRVFDQVFNDARMIGLSHNAVSMIRTSGIHYRQFTVQEAIRRGIIWMDEGFVDGNQPSMFPVYGPGAHLWMQRNMGWFDNDAQTRNTLEYTRRALDLGGLAEWGAHPKTGLDNGSEAGYAYFSSRIATMAREYPHAEWDFVQNIAKRANQFDAWRNFQQEWDGDTLIVTFDGWSEKGTSLVVYHDEDVECHSLATLEDGREVYVIQREGRAFILLPELSKGHHRVALRISGASKHEKASFYLPNVPELDVWPVPTNGPLRVVWEGSLLENPVSVSLFDLLGRKVAGERWTPEQYRVSGVLPTDGLASGIYFLHLSQARSPLTVTRRIVVVK